MRARLLENVFADLRFATRALRRTRGWALMAVVTLALGVAATTTAYAAIRVLLLDPLPFRAADELVLVRGSNPQRGLAELPVSYPDFDDWRWRAGIFQELAAWTSQPGTTLPLQQGSGDPEEVQVAYVSENLFGTLGVEPALGPGFGARDGEHGSVPTVVLSYSLWRRRFGGDRALIGSKLLLDGRAFTVRGVLPAGFRFSAYPRDAALYIPLVHEPNPRRQHSRGTRYLGVIGRVASGQQIEAAHARLAAFVERTEREHPMNAGYRVELVPLKKVLVGDRRTSLDLLAAVCIVLLLIAALNVTNLVLARTAARRRELALRHALGADSRRLAALLFAEHFVIASAGGVLGCALAVGGTMLIAPVLQRDPSYLMPFDLAGRGITLEWSSVLFVMAIAVAAAGTASLVGFAHGRNALGRAPGVIAARSTDDAHVLRIRRRLVGVEAGLATVLLVAAGLLGRSLWSLRAVEPGFRGDKLYAADVRLSAARYAEPHRVADFWNVLLQRVGGGGVIDILPLSGADQNTGIIVEGQEQLPPAERPRAHHRVTSPGWFALMSIPVLAGRAFRDDGHGGAREAMINASLARRLFPDGAALGRRISLDFEAMVFRPDGPPQFDPERGYRTIVGVVGDVRGLGLDEEPHPEFYVPLADAPARAMTVVFHAPHAAHASIFINAVRELDAEQPVGAVRSVNDVVASSITVPRSRAAVFGALAATALLLVAAGIYGMVSYAVSLGRKDIGIRLALGATRSRVRRDIVRHAIGPVLLALPPGLVGGWLAARSLRGMLYGTMPLDAWTFALVPLFLLAVATFASVLPASSASNLDPVETLRSD